MRRFLVVSVMAVSTIGTAACTTPEPPPPAPTLPAGIGVSTLEDVGGTNDPTYGTYTPSFQRKVLMDGVTTGPTPVGPGLYPSFIHDPDATPDGTARYPWNGFAGEGVTFSSTDLGSEVVNHLSFPSGGCAVGTVVAGTHLRWITPSPDGHRVALLVSRDDGSQTIEVRSLMATATCPLTVAVPLSATSVDGDVAQGPFVWRPDSSAVMYMRRHLASGASTWSIDRLDAKAGSVPSIAVTSGADVAYPLGWSIVNRLLVWRLHAEPTGEVTADLFTTPARGGDQRVLDSATYPSFAVSKWNFGYYIPGTTNLAMAAVGGSVCVNDCPYRYPLLRLTIRADYSKHLDTVYSYLGFGSHYEPVGTGSPPSYAWAQNSGMIDRFIH